MPLSKQPLEVSLGGAVEEGNVKELVQPPRIREAQDCASLKGGAYTKRDQLLTPGSVDDSTVGAAHVNDGLVTVAPTTVRVYPDDDNSEPSESNPAPFTELEVSAFEPTEADAVKEHGDSATLIIDGVPRTMCMWNVDPAGAYTWDGLGDNVNPRTAPLASSSGAALPQKRWRDEWWTYLPVGGVRYAVFDEDKQVGAEQTLPVPPLIDPLTIPAPADFRTQAQGPPCFPRVRAFEYEDGGDTVRGFVSCAALSTPQIVEERSDGEDPPTGGWDYRTEGARLSTRTQLGITSFGGGTNPIVSRDIMARNFDYAVFPDPVPGYPEYVQPGFVITRHDENGAIQESGGIPQTFRGTSAMEQNDFLRLPGPALDMVVVPSVLGASVYTLHVDYNMTDRNDLAGTPPYRPNTTYQNEIRIIRWSLTGASSLSLTGELRFNEQGVTGGGLSQIINPVPDIPGRTDSGLYDWPAGLHDTGDGLMLVMSSTQYALIDYTLGGLPPAVWKPPFWGPGDLTRLKIGRQRGLPPAECIQPEANNWINRGDAFERRTTYSVDPPLWSQTTQMARGAWAGSFLTQPDEEGNRWLGVQAISDQWNVSVEEGNRAPGEPNIPEGGHPYRRIFAPQAVSGSILHTLLDSDLDSLGFDEVAGCIPGSVIASQGVFVPGIGHCVSIHASAAGDDRTGSQEIGDLTLGDVPSPTNFIVTRRDLPLPSNGESRRERPWARLPTGSNVVGATYSVRDSYPVNSPYVTAVAIVQALPYGQAMGTYMNNPYQLRVNLRLDADRVLRWTAHQRYSPAEAFGSGSLQQPQNDNPGILKPTGSSSSSAPYELSMSLQRQLPQLVSHGSYVTTAGAAPMVTGGPQGFLAGIALQAIADTLTGEPRNEGIDQPGYYIPTDAFTTGDITNPYPTPEDPPVPIPDALIVASYLAVYDELGGEHRTLPVYLNRGYAYDEPEGGGVTEKNVTRLAAILYAVPWQIAGISLSETGTVNFFQGNESQEGIPTSVAVAHLPFVSHENYLLAGPSFPSSSPESLGVFAPPIPEFNPIHPFDSVAQSYPGSGAACYTWSGELGADAPDPSRAVGTAGNRLWSVSSVDPRKVQYTKTLRKGYAPEWNQQLFVRVPDTAQELTAVAGLPDGRILLFSPTTIHYTYGSGPSDTGQGSGFAEPAALSTDVGCRERLSVVSGDFGCMFRSDRGFYLVDRKLTLTYVGLPYEDSTSVNTRVMGTAIDSLRSEVLFFTDDSVADGTARTWVFNTLRGQWSTFVMAQALTVTERNGRPFWIEAGPNRLRAYPSEQTAAVEASGEAGSMSLTTGWLPMAKVQGYGRTWEMQITGEREPGPGGFSLSGLKVELLYDYDESSAETYFFNEPAEVGGAQIKLRLRPRKQKSEALSVRFSEYVPPGVPGENCTGWRLDMLTVLVGVKVGLDKVPTTPRDNT